MEFIETPTFTRLVLDLLTDDEYKGLQLMLASNPACGDIVPGGGGVRKVRYGLRTKGKRGGVRVIYYWVTKNSQIYLLLLYAKARQENFTEEQKKVLRDLVKGFGDGQ